MTSVHPSELLVLIPIHFSPSDNLYMWVYSSNTGSRVGMHHTVYVIPVPHTHSYIPCFWEDAESQDQKDPVSVKAETLIIFYKSFVGSKFLFFSFFGLNQITDKRFTSKVFEILTRTMRPKKKRQKCPWLQHETFFYLFVSHELLRVSFPILFLVLSAFILIAHMTNQHCD